MKWRVSSPRPDLIDISNFYREIGVLVGDLPVRPAHFFPACGGVNP